MDYFDQQSERLQFRKLTEHDIPGWVDFFEDNDRLHYLGIDLSKPKDFLAEEWIKTQLTRYKSQGLGHLAAQLKTTGEFIGMGGIIPRELNGQVEYEIAYSLLPKYWGNGYATELAKCMYLYGQNNIKTDRFISIIDISNSDSAKVAVKNGMKIMSKTKYLGMSVNVFGIENH